VVGQTKSLGACFWGYSPATFAGPSGTVSSGGIRPKCGNANDLQLRVVYNVPYPFFRLERLWLFFKGAHLPRTQSAN